MSHDPNLYPARYQLQRKDGDRWMKLGNGANDTGPLTRRKNQLTRQRVLPGVPVPQFRVYDRIDGCEVIEVPAVDAPEAAS